MSGEVAAAENTDAKAVSNTSPSANTEYVTTAPVDADELEATPKPDASGPLDAELAMKLAQYWYDTFGPYRHMYRMQPRKAMRNEELEWSVKFRVKPDPGYLYFRRFLFDKGDDGEWFVHDWAENPEVPPGEEFDPEEYVSEDDLETLEEEEAIAGAGRESHASELASLEEEGEMPIEELMKKYGYPASGDSGAGVSTSAPATTTAVGPVTGAKRSRDTDEEQMAEEGGEGDGNDTSFASAAKRERSSGAKDRQQPKKDNEGETRWWTASDTGSTLASTISSEVAARAPLPDYFHDDYVHEEETDMYVRIDSENTMRVGAQYQAELPALDPTAPSSHLVGDATLMWHPPGPLDEEQEHAFELIVRNGGGERFDRPLQSALDLVHTCGYEVEKAQEIWARGHYKPPLPWSPEEMHIFEQGLCAFGKNFFNIARELEQKSVKQVVQFYYDWKRTIMYDDWLKRGGTFEGQQRKKHLFEPGRDIDRFQEEPLDYTDSESGDE
eukprot:UC1_evm2s1820